MSSYGQQLCGKWLKAIIPFVYLENYRPPWLYGMELDFFYPELNLAVEFNGDQHYINTEAFGDCAAQKSRDARKKEICKQKNIRIVTLRAFDLTNSILRCKFKKLLKNTGSKIKPCNQKEKISLDEESSKYRRLLFERFNSKTSYKKEFQNKNKDTKRKT